MNTSKNGSTAVIKVGGAVLSNEAALRALLHALKASQCPFVLVHGGGQLTDDMLSQAGFTSTKLNGQRITPQEQMPVIVGALAGMANKTLVLQAQECGFRAIGISLADGPLVRLEQNQALGCVGVPAARAALDSGLHILESLIALDLLPIISSIGVTESGILCNVNADLAAAAIADLLSAQLILLSDVPAILDLKGQAIGALSMQEAKSLLEQDFVQGGMRVKLSAAILAAERAKRATTIAGWASPEDVVAVLHGAVRGTQIKPA